MLIGDDGINNPKSSEGKDSYSILEFSELDVLELSTISISDLANTNQIKLQESSYKIRTMALNYLLKKHRALENINRP